MWLDFVFLLGHFILQYSKSPFAMLWRLQGLPLTLLPSNLDLHILLVNRSQLYLSHHLCTPFSQSSINLAWSLSKCTVNFSCQKHPACDTNHPPFTGFRSKRHSRYNHSSTQLSPRTLSFSTCNKLHLHCTKGFKFLTQPHFHVLQLPSIITETTSRLLDRTHDLHDFPIHHNFASSHTLLNPVTRHCRCYHDSA